jgi:DNA polymerase zeta
VPFFGYNVGYKTFLKVYLLNPLNMNRLADLLIQGAVLARFMQPHESHMQYLAQWMCDYNLFGCSFIDCEEVRFRGPVPEYEDAAYAKDKWHTGTIKPEWLSDEAEVQRQSHCTLEVDVRVQDIINRREIKPRYIHHDFMERFQELAPDEKFVHSMAGLWRDETIRRKKKMGLKDVGSSPFPAEVMVSMSADPRAEKSDWIHEEEFRDLIRELVDQENRADRGRETNFDSFIKIKDGLDRIQSAFESREDLYPENIAKLDADVFKKPHSMQTPAALVNEESISQAHGDVGDGYHSDEEAAKEIFLSQQQQDADAKLPEGKEQEEREQKTSGQSNSGSDGTSSIDFAFKSREINQLDEVPIANVEGGPDLYGGHVALKRKLFQNDEILADVAVIKRKCLLETPRRNDQAARDGHELQATTNGKSSTARRVTFQDAPAPNSQNGPPSSSQLSQGSIKSHGTKPVSSLGFPVVKNAHDPDTELRLSQRPEYSNVPPEVRTPAPQKTNGTSSKESPITPFMGIKSASSDQSPGIMRIAPAVLQMSNRMPKVFTIRKNASTFCWSELPPNSAEVTSSMLEFGLPPVIYQDAYYSDERDVPERPREYAGKEFKLESTSVPYLPDFDPLGNSLAVMGEKPAVVRDKKREEAVFKYRRQQCSLRNWEYSVPPPSFDEVKQWSRRQSKKRIALERQDSGQVDGPPTFGEIKSYAHPGLSQLDGPTQKSKHGFKFSQKQKATSVEHETQYMTLMSLEVHVNTRGTFVPDPAEDEIACIVWSIQADVKTSNIQYKTGVLVLSDESGIAKDIAASTSTEVEHEEEELDLLNRLVDIVRDLDPDILAGYEVHNGSWGYLIERARVKYDFDLCDELSRMKSQSHGRFGKDADRWGFTTTSTIRVTGRHMINIWRAMRGELNLLQYTMENVAFHLLHKRIPHYAFADLTRWYCSGKSRDVAKTVNYFLSRVQINLQILEANELIPRTSEQARLLGVDFFSVFSRGSQFKVESIMFRIAKPENFILVSPSRKQVGQQNALECLPLVMEPQSAFYPSPLLVLDFQSLYPSVMIAYNYCYSTFLGRVVSWRGTNKMGFTLFKREPRLLELVKDYVNIAPNGIMYVKPEMRKSLLAKMLSELLETRVMVKSGMKQDKDDRTLQALLNNRQLALKLLANVTYGYTSASFSGRMPCSEIADSIVQTGRETLEKAIALIHSVERWGAEVVYGDTDSLFVYLKGRTRDQAFDIGQEIAEAVTSTNPRPIKLKFEKVYHPCVLLAKKRYVGFKYEHKNQKEPEFDAKGIETVRRDGTPADQKIEEKALKLLFRTQDLSEIKSYFQAQCTKIMSGKVSIQDFLFAKEVKLGTYSDRGPPPPGALIATRKMLHDARQEPQYGERVPYVVITGAPGARLIDRCVDPERLLNDDQVELDAEYYITKNLIPPLERIFNLVGANVRAWYDEMPKVQRVRTVRAPAQLITAGAGAAKKTLESYLHSTTCLVCRAKLPPPPPMLPVGASHLPPLPICEECNLRPELVLYSLRMRRSKAEQRVRNVRDVCKSCSGLSCEDEIKCDSRDCPVFYTRVKEEAALESMKERIDSVAELLEEPDIEKSLESLEW